MPPRTPPPTTLAVLRAEMRALRNPKDAAFLQRFFKTGPGEYGEGDVFLGIRVPVTRRVVKRHLGLPTDDAFALLRAGAHEERLAALFILCEHFRRGDERARRAIYDGYLGATAFINNWDLVDGSAPQIVGGWLAERSRAPLYRLAKSRSLWERRIAVLATLTFIKARDFDDTLRLCETLLADPEDLLHKACGWMLREIGNRDRTAAEAFLRSHHAAMPRTMLRYAIEKFPPPLRRAYLEGRVGT